MAIDQVEKRRNLARELASRLEPFMDLAYELEATVSHAQSLTFQDSDFIGQSGLQHMDAASVQAALNKITPMRTLMKNNGVDSLFEALRR